MKQTIIYAVALTFMMAVGINSHAKSWRVNNDTTRGAQFADINAAMSSADVQDGDTLYLDPGCNLTATQNVTKRVTIIGNGFFHDQGQPYGFATISGDVYFKAAGCKIEGVVMTRQCNVAADNVTIERCKIYNATGSGVNASGTNCKNATIRNCWIATYNYEIIGNGYSLYWTIENNILLGYWYNSIIRELNSATIKNNYINKEWQDDVCFDNLINCTIINNILVNEKNKNNIINGTFTDNVYHHNVISSEENTSYPNNKYLNSNVESSIFLMNGNSNDIDERFRLCEDSPAKGYATDGGDCGPYGSGYTYVPGGLPLGMPYYTEATIGSMAHDGKVNVTFKISVQDE